VCFHGVDLERGNGFDGLLVFDKCCCDLHTLQGRR
jgi:hypothetical protein